MAGGRVFRSWGKERTFEAQTGTGEAYVLHVDPQSGAVALQDCAPSARPLRILVADDDDVSRKAMVLMMRKLGYSASEARTGLGALRALADRAYDVVFLDLHMPEMDGLAAARFISQNWPESHRPALVAMVPEGGEERGACAEAGFTQFIAKPVHSGEVHRVLEHC